MKHESSNRLVQELGAALVGLLFCAGCASDAAGLLLRHPEDDAELVTLRPTLRWEPFGARMLAGGKEDSFPDITAITYELRLWHEGADQIDLVYQVEGLETPEHEVAAPLLPDTRYRWSVRACMEIDGAQRFTKWSLVDDVGERDAVPNTSCSAFLTPASLQSEPAGAP